MQTIPECHREMLTNNDSMGTTAQVQDGHMRHVEVPNGIPPQNHTNSLQTLPKSIYNSLEYKSLVRQTRCTGQLFSFWYPSQDCNCSCAFKCEFILGKDVHGVKVKVSEERFLQVLCQRKTLTAFKCGKLFTNYKLLPSDGRTKLWFVLTYKSNSVQFKYVTMYNHSLVPRPPIAANAVEGLVRKTPTAKERYASLLTTTGQAILSRLSDALWVQKAAHSCTEVTVTSFWWHK